MLMPRAHVSILTFRRSLLGAGGGDVLARRGEGLEDARADGHGRAHAPAVLGDQLALRLPTVPRAGTRAPMPTAHAFTCACMGDMVVVHAYTDTSPRAHLSGGSS